MNVKLNQEELNHVLVGLALLSLKPKLHGGADIMGLYHRVAESGLSASDPLWRSAMFTAEEQDNMVTAAEEEIRDCLKDMAQQQLDGEELVDLIAYLDADTEVLADCLQAIKDGKASLEDYQSGEHADHMEAYHTMKRFHMVDPGNRLSKFGQEVLDRYR